MHPRYLTLHGLRLLNGYLPTEPDQALGVDGEVTSVHARKVNDEEVLLPRPLFDGIWPGYETYRDVAPRDINVFVLD
ncbi:MAG: hypothetical protein ACC683_00440 [Acidimicrobiia bacterium]